MNRFTACALFLAGLSLAHAQTSGSGTAGQTGESSSSGASTSAQSSSSATSGKGDLSKTDRNFMKKVAQADWMELQSGNLALEKASSDQVKKIAKKLVDDHSQTAWDMKKIASQKGVTLPTQTDEKHFKKLQKLQQLSGADFDKEFLASNSADHKKVIEEFQKESSAGSDPDVKAFAAKYLPAIQEHAQMIDAANSTSQSAGAASSGTSQ